jgi:uncharacterized metal-binding protein YceD (DUF177 family)
MISSVEFHSDFLAFRISTNEVGVEGLKFSRHLSEEALSALLFEPKIPSFSWRALSDIQVEAFLERENDHSFKVLLKADFLLTSSCARCLEPLSERFFLDFSIRMIEAEHLGINIEDTDDYQFDSYEIDESGEDLPVGYFSARCIDLGVILREQIFFEAPDYPHCQSKDDGLSCNAKIKYESDDKSASHPFSKLLNKKLG